MKITLCMIVKNEEKDIKACLERAFQIVDDAIVVDTGSTDETLSILESLRKDYPLEIRNHQWENDFSKARNESIRDAKGDYILILDADERIFSKRNELEDFLYENDSVAYSIPIYNVYENKQIIRSNMMIRIYKNINPRYDGAIHEQILINGNKIMGNKVPSEICKIYHFGYSKVAFKEKDKSKRNIDIIMSEIEKKPEDPFNWYNKGVMEMIAGQYETALEDFIKAHRLCKGVRMAYHNDLVIRMLQCMIGLKHYKKGINFAKELVKDSLVSKLPDLYFYYGYMLKERKQYDLAIRQFRKCIQVGDVEQDSSKLGMGSFIPMIEWARILKNQNLIQDAIQKYQEAINHPSNYQKEGTNELKALLESLKVTENSNSSVLKKDQNLNAGPSQEDLLNIQRSFLNSVKTLIEQGQIDEAYQSIIDYENLMAEDLETLILKGIIAMLKSEYQKAEKLFLDGERKYKGNTDLFFNLAYFYEMKEDWIKALKYFQKTRDEKTFFDSEIISKINVLLNKSEVKDFLCELNAFIEDKIHSSLCSNETLHQIREYLSLDPMNVQMIYYKSKFFLKLDK